MEDISNFDIAIVGMAGKFPGAKTIDEFWENIKNGKESLTFYSKSELEKKGVSSNKLDASNYVLAGGGILKDKDCFDAAFFGYTPAEAELMDPQVRLLHECSWQALHNAGYNSFDYPGLIGLYAGGSSGFQWQARALLSGKMEELGYFAADNLANKDLLCTHVSYKLNLKGPSINLQSTCSTSLVAIHVAAQAILNGECDMALAGGVSVAFKEEEGYFFQEGMIASPDGKCRAFDKDAAGTIRGEGVGLVVLKLLSEAVKDNDTIHAVIKGSAINNDGNRKIGFTAPSTLGQQEVIQLAHQVAGVSPDSIDMIEAHGTGTPLGDPIEIEALTKAFGLSSDHRCSIGSVKTNIGHLDAAAGVAGLIKVVMSLKNKTIPPSLNYSSPNPKIDFDNSPFFVSDHHQNWTKTEGLRKAGVSSFGIGGTNAHIILEEASNDFKSSDESPSRYIIPISANSQNGLQKTANDLITFIKNNPEVSLLDISYTLQKGRKQFPFRKAIQCANTEELVEKLQLIADANQDKTPKNTPPVVFLFPGQGSQYFNMARELYDSQSVFKNVVDECFKIANEYNDLDLKAAVFNDCQEQHQNINQTAFTQPILFIFEYALAKLMMHWGIKPDMMLGHSIGEYCAACLAGVMTLEETIRIVSFRGKLIQQVEEGSMLNVFANREEIKHLITEQISVAAINSTNTCVVAGSIEGIKEFSESLISAQIEFKLLSTSHAFHSKMLDGIVATFTNFIKDFELKIPSIPFISNLNGEWVASEEIVKPTYWAKQLRETVYFAKGVQTILSNDDNALFIEIGPGNTLINLVRQAGVAQSSLIHTIRHRKEAVGDKELFFNQMCKLWQFGLQISWKAINDSFSPKRIALPEYPFEKNKFWIEGDLLKLGASVFGDGVQLPGRRKGIDDWFYTPTWQKIVSKPSVYKGEDNYWMLFSNDNKYSEALKEKAGLLGIKLVTILVGDEFKKVNDDHFQINPAIIEDYDKLFSILTDQQGSPAKIFHQWGANSLDPTYVEEHEINQTFDVGIFSLLWIAKSIGKVGIVDNLALFVLTSNLYNVIDETQAFPLHATMLGAVKIIPLEYLNISCLHIDQDAEEMPSPKSYWDQIIDSCINFVNEESLAIRKNVIWKPVYQSISLSDNEHQRIKTKGVYLISGGFGGMGFTIAKHLAKVYNAKIALLGRTVLPPETKWDTLLADASEDASVLAKIRMAKELISLGGELRYYSQDVSDYNGLKTVVSSIIQEFGPINGVIHTAGIIDYAGIIQNRKKKGTLNVMAPKVNGAIYLDKLIDNEELDFMVMFSSGGNVHYINKKGQVGYNCGNEFLDAFSYYQPNDKVFKATINWDDWSEVGMAVEAHNRRNKQSVDPSIPFDPFDMAMTPDEGLKVFLKILNGDCNHVMVSTQDLQSVLQAMSNELTSLKDNVNSEYIPSETFTTSEKQRPELSTAFVAATSSLEKQLVEIWSKLFGFTELGIKDNFFEIGGDSLLAITLIAKIHKKLHVKIPLSKLFEGPTIEQVANFIAVADELQYTKVTKAQKQSHYHLSYKQKQIYFASLLAPDETNYNITFNYLIYSKLDRKEIEKTFKTLIARHESLRTSFKWIDEEPVQEIHAEVNFKLDYFEINEGSLAERDAIIKKFIRPFSLAEAPLFRVGLIKMDETQYVVMLDIHHIISDAISNKLLIKEAFHLLAGQTLKPLPLQYKDYAVWHNNYMNSKEFGKAEDYWLSLFKNGIPRLELPYDFTQENPSEFGAEQEDFVITSDYYAKLTTLLNENDCSLFVYLLAITNILLHKYTGQDQIIVGTETAGRQQEELSNIVGMFVGTVPLINHIDEALPFKQFLSIVKNNLAEALTYQEYIFNDIPGKVGVDPGENSELFKVMVSYDTINTGDKSAEKESIGNMIQTLDFQNKTTIWDLRFGAFDLGHEVLVKLTYATAKFTPSTCKKFGARLIEIANFTIDNADLSLGEIEIYPGTYKASLPEVILETDDFCFN